MARTRGEGDLTLYLDGAEGSLGADGPLDAGVKRVAGEAGRRGPLGGSAGTLGTIWVRGDFTADDLCCALGT